MNISAYLIGYFGYFSSFGSIPKGVLYGNWVCSKLIRQSKNKKVNGKLTSLVSYEIDQKGPFPFAKQILYDENSFTYKTKMSTLLAQCAPISFYIERT